ncbi:MAG: oligopeptide transport system permease protein AppB, partial [Acidobacteria bacterium]|nr:oligopeptide transport system permease protein AppB [Acidobacteriota bacterium]
MHLSGLVLRRTAQLILISLLASLATFWMSSLIPGDFFSTHLLDTSVQKETVEQLRQRYGLEQPFYIQFARWLKNLLQLDLGYSLFYQRPVISVVADAITKTLWIGIPAIILGFGVGIVLGTVHALSGRHLARILDVVSTTALSLPSLLLGLAALLFAAHSGWFPLGSMNSPGSQDAAFWRWAVDRIHHLCLPVACLTIPVLAYVERIQYAATQ